MIQRAARLLIAIALLIAQQAALGHQIWHLGKHDSQPAQTLLCEQHQALSTVAGALDCATLDAPLVATVEAPLPIVARAVLPAPRLTAVSRSPPVLLS
jgi:hypothetical protein